MKYENMKLDSMRGNIETKLSSLLSYSFKALGCSSQEIIDRLDNLIFDIENIFINEKEEDIQYLLGGEFNKDIIYKGGDFFPEKSSIPLYFSLDLLIKSLESNYLNKINNNEALIERLRKLLELKEQSKNLKFNPKFNPNFELDEYTMEDIISSKGNFELGYDTKEGIKYLSVTTHWSHTPGYAKNGDYYTTGPTTRGSSDPQPLYQKDAESIKNERFGKLKLKVAKLDAIANKYFKDGKIPTTHDFHYNLKDENLDRRLVMALFSISMKRDKSFTEYDFADRVGYEIEELYKVEKIVEQELELKKAEEKRTSAIDSARRRYREKSFLWRLVNKKLDPKNQSFDDMTTEEIDALYRRKRG